MIVKETSNLFLQLNGIPRRIAGKGVSKKLPLDVCRKVIPLREHCCSQALQDMFFLGGQASKLVTIILPRDLRSPALILPFGDLLSVI